MDILTGTIGVGLGVMIGLAMDINRRYQIMKSLLKKDYIILSIVNQTTGLEDEHIVERNPNVIKFRNMAWVSKGAKYYLRLDTEPSKESNTTDKKEPGKEQQSPITKGEGATLKLRRGVPILYVSSDDFIPIEMNPPRKDAVSAEAVNSALQADNMNTTAKRVTKFMEDLKKMDLKLLLVLLGLAGLLILVWTKTGDTNAKLDLLLNITKGG